MNNTDQVANFLADLETFFECAKDDGVSISAKPNKNYRYIGDFLAKYQTSQFSSANYNNTDMVGSLKDLLESCKSLEATCQYLQEKIELAKHAEKPSSYSIKSDVDSAIMIRDCFQLVRTAINRKHKKRVAEDPLFICALCWKRVRVSDSLEEAPRKDSTFYCPDHLPNLSEHHYRKDRTALFSAMKSTSNRFLKELENYKRESLNPPAPVVYKWLNTFSLPSSSLFSFIQRMGFDDTKWHVQANLLMNKTIGIYPIAYERVKEVDADDYDNPAKWLIDGVISALDDDKNESEATFWWKEEVHRIKLSSFARDTEHGDLVHSTLSETNEYLMLMCVLVSRYEAFQIVSLTEQPRGGGNQKKQILRTAVSNLLANNIAANTKPNVKSIATQLGISAQRVYVIKKELEQP